VLEGARRPGAKILVSGGTRCNVTNTSVSERDFWGGRSTIVRRVLRALPVTETVAFFAQLGVGLHEEADGKLFPHTNRARDVLEALLRETDRVGASVLTGQRVLDVARTDGSFIVATSDRMFHARAVVLATGGQSLPKTGSDGVGFNIAARLGHTIVAPTPGLAPLVLGGPSFHRDVAGVAQDVELTVWIDGAAGTRLTGALLWTHFGVSGPVALDASRHWHRAALDGRAVSITANFCVTKKGSGVDPFFVVATFEQTDEQWTMLTASRPKMSVLHALATRVPASLAAAMVAVLDVDGRVELAHLSREDRRRLVHGLVTWPLPVTGSRGYNYAEVTAGGVALGEVDPSTLESRLCPGLFFVGEILDVDGRLGGFNFQWAWSSGRVAGAALAARHMNAP
jgi:predicted Rossmann fold flavoprotein